MIMEGFDELYEKLKALSNPLVAKEALRRGIRLGGEQVQATAKMLCPVGDPQHDPNSGQLRNSIAVEDAPDEGDTVAVKIGSNVEHAGYVEFGTGMRGEEADIPSKAVYNPSYTLEKEHKCKDEKLKGTMYPYLGMKPQPYLYPALEANKDNVLNIVKSTLQKEIEKR